MLYFAWNRESTLPGECDRAYGLAALSYLRYLSRVYADGIDIGSISQKTISRKIVSSDTFEPM